MCRMGMRDESPRRWLLGLTDQPRITRQRSCRARWRSNNGSSNGENLTPSKAFPVVPTSTFIYVVIGPLGALGGRPDYSITSSASASSVGGTSRPSAFAVLRLIVSSYLVGAC